MISPALIVFWHNRHHGPYRNHFVIYCANTNLCIECGGIEFLSKGGFRTDENFSFEVSTAIAGVDTALLNPRGTWTDGDAYDAQAKKLVAMFIENFAKFESRVTDDVKAAAPKAA